jgi:hypothetical protein
MEKGTQYVGETRELDDSTTLITDDACFITSELRIYNNAAGTSAGGAYDAKDGKPIIQSKKALDSIVLNIGGKKTTFTISASVDPNTFRLNKIKKQKNDISSEKELITIEDAIQKYETSLVDQQTSLNDIIWSKETNLKTYQMYSELEADLGKWYKAGITKESEYLSAKTNKEKYKINLLINDIDLIIYNIETNLLFNRDEK